MEHEGHPDAPKEGGFELWTEAEGKLWPEAGHPPAKEEPKKDKEKKGIFQRLWRVFK